MTTPADQPITPLDPDSPGGKQAAEELSEVLARVHLRLLGENRPANDLDGQDRLAAAIYFVPPAEGVEPHYAFDYDSIGPKRYLNLWLRTYGENERVTWSWVLHDSAVLLWQMKADT